MAGQGEMFQELEEKRREDGFFPKLHKAGQPINLFFSQSKNFVMKTEMIDYFFVDLFMNFDPIQPQFPRGSVPVRSVFIAVNLNLHFVYKILV
jgi:hypothetical protein